MEQSGYGIHGLRVSARMYESRNELEVRVLPDAPGKGKLLNRSKQARQEAFCSLHNYICVASGRRMSEGSIPSLSPQDGIAGKQSGLHDKETVRSPMSDKTILRSFGPSAGALPAPSSTAAGRGSSGSLTYLHTTYTTPQKRSII
jgi:hypothetical protein